MIKLYVPKKRHIYALEFCDNYVYVGLTGNTNTRKNTHLSLTDTVIAKNATVTRHMVETGLKPEYIILTTEPLDEKLAKEMEGFHYDIYKNNGWKMLNVNKTGCLGGGIPKWTKEKIKEYSNQCKTIEEFHKSIPYFVRYIAIKNNWYNELTSHMTDPRIWTDEKIIKEGNKYKKRIEFKKNCPNGYHYALKHKLMDIIFPNPKIYIKWTDETSIEYGKKCKTITQFQKEYGGGYTYARTHNLLDVIFIGKKPRIRWTKEKCIEEMKKYKTRNIFDKNCGSGYKYALKHKLLDIIFPKNI